MNTVAQVLFHWDYHHVVFETKSAFAGLLSA